MIKKQEVLVCSDKRKNLWKADPDCFNTTNQQILCSLPTSLAAKQRLMRCDEFMTPTRHTCTHCQPTGLLDQRKTPATSDGHPCCGMGRISMCFQLLTGRDEHLDSQRLCWITIGWGRQWVNRKINWLCFSSRRLGKIRWTKLIRRQMWLINMLKLGKAWGWSVWGKEGLMEQTL